MKPLSGMRVVVAGGGAMGSAAALCLRRAGAEVILADPAPLADNASGVAAGMLAPAFEAVMDPVSAGHFELFSEALRLWPQFAASVGASVERCGALWAADREGGLGDMPARLAAIGAETRLLSPLEAARLSPGLVAPSGAVFTPCDWRLEPRPMLMAMRAALVREGGEVRNAAVIGFEPGRVRMTDAEAGADALVLASGLPPAGFAEPPVETARLCPIKGQIMRARGAAPRTGPVIRGAGVYVVPGQDGPWIGATMEAGAGDRRIDPSATARLCAQASMLFPDLVRADVEASAGVRASTPDGLPLVGESARAGLFMALGARRNGWLLAPMVGELIARRLAGGDVPASLQARRFEASRVS